MSVTEAQRLRGKRVPVTTEDGRIIELFYDLEALAEIEDEFGSLGGLQDVFGSQEEGQPMDRKFIRPLLKLIKIGLNWNPEYTGARFAMSDLQALFAAMNEAMAIAMPESDNSEPDPKGSTSSSNGIASTTSAPSASAVATTSSGV